MLRPGGLLFDTAPKKQGRGAEVSLEADIAPGLPGLELVGLADESVQESRERLRAALRNSVFRVPLIRVIVSLAPADLRKECVVLLGIGPAAIVNIARAFRRPPPFLPMNPVLPAAALIAALTASPAIANPEAYKYSKQNADWQAANNYCRFHALRLGDPRNLDPRYFGVQGTRCAGVSITGRSQVNINFEGTYPAATPRNTLITFIIAPGAKGGTLPVEAVALLSGSPDQAVATAKSGKCRMTPSWLNPYRVLRDKKITTIQCSATIPNANGGKDFIFIGIASFDQPLTAPIARRFEP